MAKLPTLACKGTAAGADTDIIPVFQDGKKAVSPKGPYGALIERFRRSGAFDASPNAVEFVRFGGKGQSENVVFVGMGKAKELTLETLRQAAGTLWSTLGAEKVKHAAVHLAHLKEAGDLAKGATMEGAARAFAEGLGMAAYRYETTRPQSKNSKSDSVGKVTFVAKNKTDQSAMDKGVKAATAAVEAISITREWSNLPANIGTPEYYAKEARKLAEKYGLKCRVLTEKDAQREKMGLLLSVGHGSENPSRVVVLEYTPKARTKAKTVALVGKGVTFDTGGISLKPGGGMEDMKHDMTGAATMMGAILLAARLKVPHKVVAVLGFVENMPSGRATRPGDVVKGRSGKTVEIINTDAEGRLVLADALDYAQDLKPDVVIDSATLTGAVLIALGKYAAAVLGNDDKLVEDLRKAGNAHGERLWQLPLYDEYFNDMKTPYADMRNIPTSRMAGTITAAMFLKQFIRKGTRWAHIDIAATAWDAGNVPYLPKKGASGTYVRTLAQFVQDL